MSGHRRSEESAEDSGNSRRARKRATDRRAQQHHRQRRKAYVKQLEETVKELSDRHSSEERIAGLLEEQKRLRERCAKLTKLLDNVRTLLAQGDISVVSGRPEVMPKSSENGLGTERRGPGGEAGVGSWPVPDAEQGCELDGNDASDCYEPLVRVSFRRKALCIDPLNQDIGLEPDFGFSAQDAVHADFLESGNIAPMFSLGDNGASNDIENALENCASETADTTCATTGSMALGSNNASSRTMAWSALSYEGPTQDPSAMCLLPSSLSLLPATGSQLSFLNFPKTTPAAGAGDIFLEVLLREARREHMSGMFTSDRPTLSKLLVDPPPDIVAYRLFQFISSYGAMPMHLLLATFWVQYLLLRVGYEIISLQCA